MFEQFVYSPGMWHGSCVPVKEKMKLTRTDLSNAKAFDMFMMPLCLLVYTLISRKLKHAWELVPRGGIEPPTQGFSVLCSTD